MVKRFAPQLISLCFIVAGVVAAQSVPLRKDIPAIAKAANGSIVTIITATNDKPIAQGTGFVVSTDGVIVTNYHVIETGNSLSLNSPTVPRFRLMACWQPIKSAISPSSKSTVKPSARSRLAIQMIFKSVKKSLQSAIRSCLNQLSRTE